VKRRITWHLDTRSASALFLGEQFPTKFKWADLPRPPVKTVLPSGALSVYYRDFEPDEDKVRLIWDGVDSESFLNEVELKIFIIRFVYNIIDSHLIPSELLAEANLVYETGDWVDEWWCTDKNTEIIEADRQIYPPANRKIRIASSTRQVPRPVPGLVGQTSRFSRRSGKPHIHAKVNHQKSTSGTEIPDDKCFYAFKAGGFYENKQNPLEKACKDEKSSV
jgi:hypothetical protein